MSKISVVMSIHNDGDRIEKSVKSVLNQTYDAIELIIVDNASTDNTHTLINSINDDRIKYYKLEQNKGHAVARNFGVKMASSDLIAFIESDVVWSSDKLERQMKCLDENPGYALVYSAYMGHMPDNSEFKFPHENLLGNLSGKMLSTLLFNNTIELSTMLVKRVVFENEWGFDEELKSIEDWFFAVDIARDYEIGYIEDALADIYMSEGRMSSNMADFFNARCRMIAKYKNYMILNNFFDVSVTKMFESAESHGILEQVQKMLMLHIESEENGKPKISVIIPCYNVEQYIERCLRSVGQQSIGWANLEIICVDDASTDGTLEILKKWEETMPDNMIVIHCDENGRQGRARNIGLEYATAEYVAFIDSDDWIEPDYFEKLLRPMKKYGCEIVSCQSVRDSSCELSSVKDKMTGEREKHIVIDSEEKRKHFIIFRSINSYIWGKLIRRDFLLENQLFFMENVAYEDTAWGALVHLYASNVYVVEERLYHYFVNPDSTVLLNNGEHHVDLLTVHIGLWQEYINRKVFDKYCDEVVYDYLISCYLSFLKVIILRFDEPDYNLFLLAREIILERIPDYEANKYIRENVMSDYHNELLKTLKAPMSKSEFISFVELVKKIGI